MESKATQWDVWFWRDVLLIPQEVADAVTPGQTAETTLAAVAEAFRMEVEA